MIPEIGVMVGLYVITRMFQLVTDEITAGSVKVFGVITALVAAVVMADVLVRSMTSAKELERLLPR
jgi:hypothetical protein